MIKRFMHDSVKWFLASLLILSAGGFPVLASEGDGSKVSEDGGGQGGVTWQEYYRRTSGSYTIITYRSVNGGSQWKEVTYNQSGGVVKIVYGSY
ncbi:hypothetical protein [Bacillus sp. KH172YL63]|uniref:hypothetical protein n=1 Tax=Bacillus sp. KH172YL63 TaxID=2709784 RepID=UPI0013E4B55D|nr:hypothetical protein [Bacillus sp. KH172YL63]BCB03984.1 hypothetical protein KH172YL63_21170 [Bacillus sp. KH172YL63]